MNQETRTLFQTLTELPGAPGNEHLVRRFMKKSLKNMLMRSSRTDWEACSALNMDLKTVRKLWWPAIWMKWDLW